MSASPAVFAAATTLAEWARDRRRVWSDVPLDVPAPVRRQMATAVLEPEIELDVEPLAGEDVAIVEPLGEPIPESIPEPIFEVVEAIAPEPIVAPPLMAETAEIAETAEEIAYEPEPVAAGPSVFERAASAARVVGAGLSAAFIVVVDRLEAAREPILHWLIRGAALASTASVVGLIVINRGELFTRWDHVSSMVVAAANRPPSAPPPVVTLPKGVGRLTVTSGETEATVLIDGQARGTTPVTMNLPAGSHRVLLRSPQGTVERAIRVESGESSEVNEAIYPGWVALTSAVDVTLSEGGKPLKRDERGWAILPPGPHDIQLENRGLGIHEVRRVVVKPGDTARLSFAARSSTISLTTNELAEVWIDGQSYGQAPLVDQPIAIGVHDVRLRSAAHERWIRVRATVQPVQVNVDLTAGR